MTIPLEQQVRELAGRVRDLRDIEDMRLLVARYHLACDGAPDVGTHRDPDGIADLFMPDGVWDIPGGPYIGRAQIIAQARALQTIVSILHTVANPIVAIDGDTAQGEFKGFVRSRRHADDEAAWSIGTYRTRAQRTPQGWRFTLLKWDYLVSRGEEVKPSRADKADSS